MWAEYSQSTLFGTHSDENVRNVAVVSVFKAIEKMCYFGKKYMLLQIGLESSFY